MTVSSMKLRYLVSRNDHQNIAEENEPPAAKSDAADIPLDTSRSNGMYKGLLLALICGFMYTACALIVKLLTKIQPAQIMLYRFVVIFVLSLPLAVKTQKNLLGPQELRFLIFFRGICGTTYIFLNYIAYQYLPLGEAAVIIHSAPIFVSLSAKIFLRERCGIAQSVIVLITVLGIIFILKVPAILSGRTFHYSTEYIYGLVAAFSSLISLTGLFIVLRKLKGVHHSIIMLNFGWIGFFGSCILTAITGHISLPECGLRKWLLILVGVLSQAAGIIFTIALQLENAGPVSTVMSASEVTLSFLLQTFFFSDTPDTFSIAGAVLLGVAIVLAGLDKWASSLRPDSATPKYLKFFTF